MYLEYFGLAEAPFRITPHTDFFFEGANRGATLDALLYAITHDEGIVKVSGEVGSGKTMLCRVLMERLPQNVETIHLANPSLSRDEILFTLADELGVDLATNRVSAVLRALQEHLIERYSQGRQVVVLIDEAHAMPAETLEEIRLLSNLESNRHKLLQIVLFGQPELNDNLGKPEMRQLKERITHNFSLEPLVRSDVADYVNFRMRAAGYKGPDVFTPSAFRLIARASLGLTRRINILADKSLLSAYAGNTHSVTVAHVRAAIRDAEFRGSSLNSPVVWMAAVAALLALAAGLAYYQYGMAPASNQAGMTEAPPPSAPTVPNTPPPSATQAAATSADALSTESKPASTPLAASPAGQPIHPPRSALVAPTAVAVEPLKQEGQTKPGRLTRQRLEETRNWLDSVGEDRWFIQLLSTDANSVTHVENFLNNAARLAEGRELRVYSAEVRGARRLGVIYGDYPSREAATSAIGGLPAELRTYGPYPRQVRRLRN